MDNLQYGLLEAKVQDALEWVKKTNKKKFLHFLDPGQQHICNSLLRNHKEIQGTYFGGHEYCERKMLCIHRKNENLSIREWPIVVFHLEPTNKSAKLKHSQILGTFIHLGIKREKIGDINITEQNIQIFVAKELSQFVTYNLNKISNTSVGIREVDLDQVLTFSPPYDQLFIVSASLRLDGVISGIFNLSRKEASNFITSGKVKVNWHYSEKPSMLVKEKDMVSVRGKGRALIYEILGDTKKGNKKILIHKYK